MTPDRFTPVLVNGSPNLQRAARYRASISGAEDIQVLMTQQQALFGINVADLRRHQLSHKFDTSKHESIEDVSRNCVYLDGSEQEPQYLPQRKRVLMVASALARGGCERQILATAVGLLRQGYQVEIFCFAAISSESDFTEEFLRLGINCRHLSNLGDSMHGKHHAGDVQGLQKFAHLVTT
jgi:hypothetical protein